MGVSVLDLSIIVGYLAIMLVVGFFLGRKEGAEGFFVNNRKTKTIFLTFTALSTSVGAATVLGMAAAAYSTGISAGLTFALISLLGWTLVAWLAPRIKAWGDRLQAYTFGDFFAARYSGATRRVGSIVVLTAYFFIAAIQFVAFAALAEVIGGINFGIALFIAALITITYTVFAGLKGDIYTDVIQFFIMFPIFIFLFIAGFSKLGFSGFIAGIPGDFLNIFNYAGPAFFFGAIALGFPLLLTSMEVWQRAFAAVNARSARKAFMFSGLLKIVFIAAVVLIGLMAFQLVPGVDQDAAIFVLMKDLLPRGILGLGFASILAILMSTVDSLIIVGSATITKDYYLVKNPDASEKKILRVGRISTLLFGVGAFLVALVFQDIIRLTITGVQILIIFGPALLGGLLWKRATAPAAFWSILVGFIVTVGVLPFMPDTAFIPGVILAIIIFLVLSFAGSRKKMIASGQPSGV